MIPPRKYSADVARQTELSLSISRRSADAFLSMLLLTTVLNALEEQFPVASAAKRRFLKWLVELIEAQGFPDYDDDEVCDSNSNVICSRAQRTVAVLPAGNQGPEPGL